MKFNLYGTAATVLAAIWLAFLFILSINLLTGFVMPREETVKTFGFPIEVAQATEGDTSGSAAVPEQPIQPLIAQATAEQGEAVFRKCQSCHDASAGGPNKVGPNLHDIVGAPIGDHNGFHASDSLKAVGGAWTYDELDKWLNDPRSVAPKTLMSFAGLKKEEDRAAVIKYLMSETSSPPPLDTSAAAPAAAPAASAAPAGGAAPAAAPAAPPAKKP
jgi:cytochrome c